MCASKLAFMPLIHVYRLERNLINQREREREKSKTV